MVSIELVPRNILIVIFCILKTFTSFHPILIYDKTFLISIYKRNVLFKTYIKSIAEQFTPRFNLNEITKPKYKFHYSIIIFSSFINNTFNRSLDMILYIKNLFYLYEYNYEKPTENKKSIDMYLMHHSFKRQKQSFTTNLIRMSKTKQITRSIKLVVIR